MSVRHTANLYCNPFADEYSIGYKQFVDCAIAANAKCIVTEDNHFNVLRQIPFPKVEVVGIDEFRSYLSSWFNRQD